MYVCVFTFPFGIFLQSGFVRTTFGKSDTIFVIQIFHNGQYLYMHCRWRFIYAEGWIGIILAGLTLPHCCVCPKPGPEIPASYVVVLYKWTSNT